jgi:hypothetical protein
MQTISQALTQDEIEYILSLPEVQAAKKGIDALTEGQVYFTVALTSTIKSYIHDRIGLDLAGTDTVPMRWIKGDTRPHIDTSVGSATAAATAFDKTHLVYLTDSAGEFILDGAAYPITKGNGYVFSEGLSHETRGTGSEPRLLLGPMSEVGAAVGAATVITADGATDTVYMRYDSNTNSIQYKINDGDYYGPSIPITIVNTNPVVSAETTLKVLFVNDIVFYSPYFYFICGSGNIQFGATSLKEDGTRPIITINGTENYPGLVQNGSVYADGNDNIYIYNLEVHALSGSTLADNGGWLAQEYFGKGTTSASNCIINCHSTGNIAMGGGGIVGAHAGPIKAVACSSAGTIGTDAGGIIGSYSQSSEMLRCESCWSTGSIGLYAGGITGTMTGIATIQYCYSTGQIGNNAGGISGRYAGGPGNTVIGHCYSQGAISPYAGGIAGSDAGTISITDCYSIGAVAANGGGILGFLAASNLGTTGKTVTSSYSTGATTGVGGYIVGGRTEENGSVALSPSTSSLTLTNNYSEAARSSAGWSTAHANATLSGTPTAIIGTIWIKTGANQPYELRTMGYTPYTAEIITGLPLSIRRTYSGSIVVGAAGSTAVIPEKSYTILDISSANPDSHNTITVNEDTGAISTTSATKLGTYTVYIHNTGSYHITEYELTVMPRSGPCCESPLELNRIDYTIRDQAVIGNVLIGGSENTRNYPMSSADVLRMKMSYVYRR